MQRALGAGKKEGRWKKGADEWDRGVSEGGDGARCGDRPAGPGERVLGCGLEREQAGLQQVLGWVGLGKREEVGRRGWGFGLNADRAGWFGLGFPSHFFFFLLFFSNSSQTI